MAERRRLQREAEEAEINITPMLDMVFILLIFFIVTTSFVRPAGINVARPSTNQQQQVVKESKIVFIELKGDGTININFAGTQRTNVELGAVRAEVEKDLAGDPSAQVVVGANPGSKAGTLVHVIDQAKQAGAKKVSIATTET